MRFKTGFIGFDIVCLDPQVWYYVIKMLQSQICKDIERRLACHCPVFLQQIKNTCLKYHNFNIFLSETVKCGGVLDLLRMDTFFLYFSATVCALLEGMKSRQNVCSNAWCINGGKYNLSHREIKSMSVLSTHTATHQLIPHNIIQTLSGH